MLVGIGNALLIVNPDAGRARRLLGERLGSVRATLAAQGIETELALATAPGAAEEIARAAAQNRAQLVIVCGGDGTLNAVVNGLAGSQVPLAVLPAGTANILAKELNVPWNIVRAAEQIKAGTPRRIALGMVTTFDGGVQNRYFLSVAGAGPDGAMVHGVNETLKYHTGKLAFWLEGLKQFVAYRFPRFRVTAGDRSLVGSLVIVSRTKHYGGPLSFTTKADLFGDFFELMVCTTRSRLLYLIYVPLACAGHMHWAPHAHFVRATSVRCEPLDGTAAWAQMDGELAGRLPAEFHIVPDALTLVIPGARAY
jgi:diacylglycerol kinase (ATP)